MSPAHPSPFVDAVGVPHAPWAGEARIISLVPSITELLFDLGLGPSLVGRTTFCVHPLGDVDAVPKVGGTKKPKLDKIRALCPTHVIVNVDENTQADFEALRAFVPNVIATHPLQPADNLHLFRLLGEIFGRDDDAALLCEAFSRALRRLKTAAAGFAEQRALYLIWRNPWMTVSQDTYVSRMLALVNWKTLGHDPQVRYPVVDPARAGTGDIVLFSSEPYPFKQQHIDEFRRLADTVPTYTMIDGEMVSWYGSRAIKGLAYLGRFRAGLEG